MEEITIGGKTTVCEIHYTGFREMRKVMKQGDVAITNCSAYGSRNRCSRCIETYGRWAN
jgi:hypothetical protein